LRPKMSEDFAGEEIHLEATLDIVTAGLDGAYNVVETCSYQNTADKDPVKLENAWKVKETSLTGLSEEELKKERKNWEIHDTQRIYIPNSYDFVIETIGIYTNAKLLKMACDIMLNKLETVEVTEIEHKKMNTDIVRGKLENEDYTYGKVIEYGLYHLYYEQQRKVSLVNFRKLHPHNTFGILRVDFKLDEEDVKERYTEYYERVKTELKQIFTAIKATF
jgi:DNA-directed RNA polymerase subunit L